MRLESPDSPRPLRYGHTTGTGATAVSLAAARLLLAGIATTAVAITLPRGQIATLMLEFCRREGTGAVAGTRKDAGDDPDVTHGALIWARVELDPVPGVRFHAGDGVGIVTRPGLPIAVGEPAINPVPRAMLQQHLATLAAACGYGGGFELTIGVEGGAELATRTLNPRLGIVDGLSILGTTGIVRPFSCSAYIASIERAIDVARANGLEHLAACTGATSERFIRERRALPAMALIEMGDFAGAVLKYLRRAPVARLSLAGGFGKFSKLAAGHLDLHSRHSGMDFDWLAERVRELGGDAGLQAAVRGANTGEQVLGWAQQAGLPLGDHLCGLARDRALAATGPGIAVEVWALDRRGEPIGFADGD